MNLRLALLLIFALPLAGLAQKKSSTPPIPDVNRMMKMTPAQLEAYKKELQQQAARRMAQLADSANITLDETSLPGTELKAPLLNSKKLAAIPATPGSPAQLMKMSAQLETSLAMANPAAAQKAAQIAAGKSLQEIKAASVASWYANNPAVALSLSLKSVQQGPDSISSWNNLAAMLNMSGMEHRAVPILKYCLGIKPGNSTLLNNLGQCYMGMGDLNKAAVYLQQSLAGDDLNPEANRAMAMIQVYHKDYDKALEYFKKEMQIAQRRSSLAYLAKTGKRNGINLAALRRQRMKRMGIPERNFCEEINLNAFKIPDPPLTSDKTGEWQEKVSGLMQSITNEIFFWMHAGEVSEEERRQEGKMHPGLYFDLVDELTRDLGNTYIPLISLFEEKDLDHLDGLIRDYYKKMGEVRCPSPPSDPNGGAELAMAYQKKCCDQKKPITDAFLAEYNEYVKNRILLVQGRYKEYINGLVGLVQLDPSPGNRRMIYAMVQGYFNFLGKAVQSFRTDSPPMECYTKMTTEEADAIISAKHDFDLSCPSWAKMNFSFKILKLKADCESYGIEADVYGVFSIGGEKKFKTGTSTLYVGAGVDGSFKGMASGSISQQLYIVFDQNNDFSDLGMRGEASGNLVNGMLEGKFGYDFSMNSGFSSQGEVKSGWLDKWESTLNKIPK